MIKMIGKRMILRRAFLYFLLFSPYFLFGQNEVEERGFMFVVAPNGLRARTTPSLSGEILTVFPYGRLTPFSRRTSQRETISGINGYWYGYLSSEYHTYLWVFGGYLADWFEPEPYLGEWQEEVTQLNWSIRYYRDFIGPAEIIYSLILLLIEYFKEKQ